MKKKEKSFPCEFKPVSQRPVFPRRKTRQIRIGQVPIGGEAPIVVQSMTKTDTRDTEATLSQIKSMELAGCDIVRLAIQDEEAVEALGKIRKRVSLPLIADIHFDHKLALASLARGIDGLRINPGNIGSKEKVREVVKAAREKEIPIRIGVNSGSLEKALLEKYGEATPEAMVESALKHVKILEDLNFNLIKISLKASDVFRTVKAYQLMAQEVDYPFHAGITEAGGIVSGAVKSAVGLTLLLKQGLADTIRVSLTASPEDEVGIAFKILSSLGIRSHGLDFVSCPVCGRAEVDMLKIAPGIERRLSSVKKSITVAVMGCMVNGPGEAKEADIGLACGRGVGVIFKRGKLYRRLEEEDKIVSEFVKEVVNFAKSMD